jgi:hypothetical protein
MGMALLSANLLSDSRCNFLFFVEYPENIVYRYRMCSVSPFANPLERQQ